MEWNNKINKQLSNLKKWLIKPLNDIIGIDLGTNSVKIVELSFKKDKPFIKNVGVTDIAATLKDDGTPDDSAALAHSIRHLLATSGITGKNAVVAISSSKIFVRELTLPAMTEGELREAIKWETENYVPYAPGSYYYDYSILPSINDTESRVLLVAAPSDIVDKVVNIVKDVGLVPLAIDIEPFALQRTINGGGNSVILDIGAELSQIILFQNGVPCVTRSIPIGGRRFTEIIIQSLNLDFSEAENLKKHQKGLLRRPDLNDDLTDIHQNLVMLSADLARELRRTLDYYQIQHKNAVIDDVILTGGGSKLDNLALYLSTQLDMPVIQHDIMASLNYTTSFNRNYLQELAPQLAVAIGLALRGGEP